MHSFRGRALGVLERVADGREIAAFLNRAMLVADVKMEVRQCARSRYFCFGLLLSSPPSPGVEWPVVGSLSRGAFAILGMIAPGRLAAQFALDGGA
jgi:hypothetical protein